MLSRKRNCLLVLCLLAGLTMGLVLPSIAASKGLVSVTSTRIIDGDPSDWIGTAGSANSFVVSQGEGIWTDAVMDDTGNGSVTYMNGTMSPPGWGGYGIVSDSAGGPDGYAYYYTEQFTATEPTWQGHGGMLDLTEVRITADSANLYMMFRIENMGSTEIACQWNSGNYLSVPLNPHVNDTTIGKIILQVFIDEDQVYGSGRTNTTRGGNFLIDPSAAWEALVTITGDTNNLGHETPDVVLADGTRILLNSTTYMMGDSNTYPAVIEVKVPFTALGASALGQTWRFTTVLGPNDGGDYRPICNTTWATVTGNLGGSFIGGEGVPSWTGLNYGGQSSNIVDMAFTSSQAAQEAILNNYTKAPGTGLAVIKAYQDIEFDAEGNVVPWIPLLAIPIALIALVIARKKLKLPVEEHQ